MTTVVTRLWRNIAGKWKRNDVILPSSSAPIINDFSPRLGAAGTLVTVTGSNFTGISQVVFDGSGGAIGTAVAASFTVVNATTLTTTTPAGATDGSISVTGPAGSFTSVLVFDVLQVPTITSFTPTSGAAGTAVTITGTNFTGATAVRFGGVNATSYTVVSSTQITTSVSSSAATGTLSVVTPSGTGTSSGTFTVSGVTTPLIGYTQVLDEQFANLARWSVYNNSNFGAPHGMYQVYMAANTILSTTTAGATSGTSLKQLWKREKIPGYTLSSTGVDWFEFTCGMIDSKTAGNYYPRYGFYEGRFKIPHGQGMWPAFWLTHRNGGADIQEVDIFEYFHGQVPGYLSHTLHRSDNAGVPKYNVAKNTGFFEPPTYVPGWHTVSMEMRPWTATTIAGGTAGNPATSSPYLRYTARIDGLVTWDYVDPQSSYYTARGDAYPDNALNIYLQGGQTGGQYCGHPDEPLGTERAYNQENGGPSAWAAHCLNGGTYPSTCTVTHNGYTVQRAGRAGSLATFNLAGNEPAVQLEIDYIRVYKYTG